MHASKNCSISSPLIDCLLLPGVASYANGSVFTINFTDDPRTFSKRHQEAVLFVQTIVIPVVCAFGILGNILNIVAFTRRRVRRSIGTQGEVVYGVLLSLAVSDLLYCACAFPRLFVPVDEPLFTAGDARMYYQMYCTGLMTTFGLISTWLIVFIAALHYVAICHPMQAKRLVRRRYAAGACVAVYVGCAVSNVPAFMQYRAVDLTSTGYPGLVLLDLGPFSHVTAAGMAFLWAKAIVGFCLPIVLLTLFNACLIAALRESMRVRKRYSATSTELRTSASNRLTTTLIVIVTVYVVLICPSELMDVATYLVGGRVIDPERFMMARTFANLLQVCNFAFNFLLYCSLNVQFRAALSMRCRGICLQRYQRPDHRLELGMAERRRYPGPLMAPMCTPTEQFHVTPTQAPLIPPAVCDSSK